MDNLIVVTDWEKVEKDDFYLSDDWIKEVGKENMQTARKLQKEGKLFIAYVVDAKDFAIYGQMDASQIFIDISNNEILYCESQVIGCEFVDKFAYDGY